MEKNTLVITLSISIIAVIAVIFFVFYSPALSSPIEETCEIIKADNNQDTSVNILFFSDGVEKEDLMKYVDSLYSFTPFNQNQDKFNFYFTDYSPECELRSSAILCHSRELIKQASVCPNDFIGVISNQPRNIRSSTFQNVISINFALTPKVFVHEFGHAFSNLADEYVPANLPRNQQNCKATCEEFNGIGSCFDGCSKNELKRSSFASIMRTLKSDSFEEINEDILNDRIGEIR